MRNKKAHESHQLRQTTGNPENVDLPRVVYKIPGIESYHADYSLTELLIFYFIT